MRKEARVVATQAASLVARDLIKLVPAAENHLFQRWIKGAVPYHSTCGKECVGEVKGAVFHPMQTIQNPDGTTVDMPSPTPQNTAVFSVVCDHCRRSLMDGEIFWR